jgi:glycerol-3-phosphate cytidylyltransferase
MPYRSVPAVRLFVANPERGLAIGVFDLFHVGHLRYLQYASKQCRELVVAVTSDRIALDMKGRLPVIPQEQRLEIVRGLGFVAEVRLLPSSTEYTDSAAAWISDWNIQQVVCGGGWQGSERWNRLEPALASYGISVQFADYTETVSTTQIIETVLKKFGPGSRPP